MEGEQGKEKEKEEIRAENEGERGLWGGQEKGAVWGGTRKRGRRRVPEGDAPPPLPLRRGTDNYNSVRRSR